MKKKILFVLPSLATGGAERQLTMLVRGITKKSYEAHVLVFYEGGQFWDELSTVTNCHLYSLRRRSRWDFTVIWKIIRYVVKHNIDLIQGWMPPANTFCAIAGIVTRKPVIMGVRASNMNYQSKGGNAYVKADGIFSKYCYAIVFNSVSGAKYHCKLGYSENKIHIIPNGINIPAHINFSVPFQHNPPWNIGILARLDEMKDHANMFFALKLLKDSGEEILLHVFGEGVESYKQELINLANKLGINDIIRWRGGNIENWQALDEVDLLVSSSYGEGLSNSIMEAMAAGRAVVATDVGDSRLLIEGEGKPCGIIAPPKDSSALAEAISLLIRNRSKASVYSENAKAVVEKKYSSLIMVMSYENLYNSALKNF